MIVYIARTIVTLRITPIIALHMFRFVTPRLAIVGGHKEPLFAHLVLVGEQVVRVLWMVFHTVRIEGNVDFGERTTLVDGEEYDTVILGHQHILVFVRFACEEITQHGQRGVLQSKLTSAIHKSLPVVGGDEEMRWAVGCHHGRRVLHQDHDSGTVATRPMHLRNVVSISKRIVRLLRIWMTSTDLASEATHRLVERMVEFMLSDSIKTEHMRGSIPFRKVSVRDMFWNMYR